jgi:hypothetical protein
MDPVRGMMASGAHARQPALDMGCADGSPVLSVMPRLDQCEFSHLFCEIFTPKPFLALLYLK